ASLRFQIDQANSGHRNLPIRPAPGLAVSRLDSRNGKPARSANRKRCPKTAPAFIEGGGEALITRCRPASKMMRKKWAKLVPTLRDTARARRLACGLGGKTT